MHHIGELSSLIEIEVEVWETGALKYVEKDR